MRKVLCIREYTPSLPCILLCWPISCRGVCNVCLAVFSVILASDHFILPLREFFLLYFYMEMRSLKVMLCKTCIYSLPYQMLPTYTTSILLLVLSRTFGIPSKFVCFWMCQLCHCSGLREPPRYWPTYFLVFQQRPVCRMLASVDYSLPLGLLEWTMHWMHWTCSSCLALSILGRCSRNSLWKYLAQRVMCYKW